MQQLGKPSMASFTTNSLQQNHLFTITLCKYPTLSYSHLFTISSLKLNLPQEISQVSLVRTHAISSKINTTEHKTKDTNSSDFKEMGSGFSSVRSNDKWVVRKSKKIDGKATNSTVSTNFREMGSGFFSLGCSSGNEGSEEVKKRYKKNMGNKTRDVDTRIYSEAVSVDELVGRKHQRNESSLDEKRKEKFGRHIHPTRGVDSGKHREMEKVSFVRSRDERVNRKLKKIENKNTVDEIMEKKTKAINSKSHGEMGDGFSSLWSKIERVDKKLKNKMTGPVADGKTEKKSKKTKVASTEFQLRIGLDMCSKKGDVRGAISLYDLALREGIKLGQYHYNVLLYLCSSAAVGIVQPAKSGSSSRSFDQMNSMNELSNKHLVDSSENRQMGNENVGSMKSNLLVSNVFSVESIKNCGGSSDRNGCDPSFSNMFSQDLNDNSEGRHCSDKMVSSSGGLVADSSEHDGKDNLNEMDQNTLFSNGFGVGMSEGDYETETNELDCKVNYGIRVSNDVKKYALARGFEIYEQMCSEKIPLSEAALTSVARMAMSMGNGGMAFAMVKQMKALGISPRLRSYGPALFAFCTNGDIKKAFEVEQHMLESGVYPEEPELEALLRLSISAGRGEKVYYLLHKLRMSARQVSPSTADLIEKWFRSTAASRVGKRKWDETLILQAIENGGGGWHGLGWLGGGKWTVVRTTVGSYGVCMGCGEKLTTIDLDPIETENFAKSVVTIAGKRERNLSFQTFQKWLDYYGPFEAVVDAANVGLFTQRKFLLSKVKAVVNGIRQQLPSKKWPLIIVHNKRISGGKMDELPNKTLIEKWKNADALYATPTGSNDDWYWLYAAIKFKCLIVTNDEMRDHIFQLLGNDFFPRWKERHQVRFSFRDGSPEFDMPPPCSVVIQESEKGHWHIPIVSEQESKREGTWLCVTRVYSHTEMPKQSIKPKETYPRHRTESAGLDALTRNGMNVLSSDHDILEKLHPNTSYPHQKTYRNPRKGLPASKFPVHRTIISDIEAAEELAGCVIDFQI